ncbi:thioredoxin-like protein [Circinella umbellata]|nr:thioredoxin-like protein [Circinella umbellata]
MDNDIPSLPQPLGEQSLESEIESILRAHPLTVFSKTYCPYSRKAKEILNEYPLKIPYYVVEVDLRNDAMEIKKLLGEHTQLDTFPNIFINGGSIGGASELSRLDKSGRLEEILKENNLL